MTIELAVLVSGRGSNLAALLDAIDAGGCDARITHVIADRDCPALAIARARAVRGSIVAPRDHASREAWDGALADAIGDAPWIVLAGFARIVGARVVERYEGRLINVHPSLLPAFVGRDAPAQAIAAGVRISGCTVHLVDRGVDDGAILAQAAVEVRADDDPASLHARIQRREHVVLPAVVHAIACGELTIEAGRPRWRDPSGGAWLERAAPSDEDADPTR
ncbi:MAG: phosphoribosylglycinamide formyltransferase [Sandaracinaceae bacterium]